MYKVKVFYDNVQREENINVWLKQMRETNPHFQPISIGAGGTYTNDSKYVYGEIWILYFE